MLLTMLGTKAPVERLLENAVTAQKTHNYTITVSHLCILRELQYALTLYNRGRIDTAVVPMKHIETKYGQSKYVISRNAVMLSKKGVQDASMADGVRKGKGFLKVVPLKKSNVLGEETYDTRNKGLQLTAKGEELCTILFGSIIKEV